jgi:hypothetical protein
MAVTIRAASASLASRRTRHSDEHGLRLDAGPGVMAGQCRHLAAASAWPNVTIQLIPGILHAGLLGSIILADDAAYIDTPAGGQVYTDDQTVKALARRFDTIRSEALPASQSAQRLTEIANELAKGYP